MMMTQVARGAVLLAAIAAMSGCSANRYCASPQKYETAPSIPPIVASEGLKIPTTTTSLRVPEAKGESLSFGYITPDPANPGKTKITCLDQPPPIPPLSDAAK